MNISKPVADPELAIWERVFVPDPQHITADQARYLLKVRFPKSDLDRINELLGKADDGTLTPAEMAELDRYVHIGHVLSIVKAKLRRSLKETAGRS